MSEARFSSMGSGARIVVDGGAPEAIARGRRFLEDFEARLTRFDPDSELCRLNADPRATVPASRLLRRAAHAGLAAAELTDGLVDPTLVRALETAGYDRDRRAAELPLAEALHEAPPRRPAAPDPHARWRTVRVDDEAGTISRLPLLALDTGGTGKGLAADMLARRLRGADRVAVDLGGDIAVAGRALAAHPFDLDVLHPLTGEVVDRVRLARGGVATSGIDVRLWRDAAGAPAHHLLDPATGRPAWTGAIGATALAPTALEAEARAKAALLCGPERAGRWLARHGGLVVRDDGTVERYGRLRPHPVVRIARAAA